MSSDRKIIADTLENEETRVAILEGGRLSEIFIERMWDHQKAGEIYKARVESVLPGINAAFVSIGDGRNAFLYLNDAQGMKIVPNQELVVQVTKMACKNKGARVTPRLSLPGRYLVLVPGGGESGVSRRIASEEERKRLIYLKICLLKIQLFISPVRRLSSAMPSKAYKGHSSAVASTEAGLRSCSASTFSGVLS